MPASNHPMEIERLLALRSLSILDTLPGRHIESLLSAAQIAAGSPMAAITLIDEDRQSIKASIGLGKLRDTPRATAFCAFTILSDKMLLVNDTEVDARFSSHPAVLKDPFIRFYAGVPLVTADGLPLGALCVMDTRPRDLTVNQKRVLYSTAHHIQDILSTPCN